jgi:hypothetical protein
MLLARFVFVIGRARLWLLVVLGPVLLVIAPRVCADEFLERAFEFLPRERYKAIEILESGVMASPNRVEYWTALLREIDVSERFSAQCLSREALKANPDSAELLFARAGLLRASPALDVLKVERLPGHEDELRMTKEALSLGMPGLASCSSLTRRLIFVGRWERADEVIQFASPFESGNPTFWECKAAILANRGAFAEAIAAQKTCQSKHHSKWIVPECWSAGNVMLARGEPAWAVKSFEGYVPDGTSDLTTLVLACALLQTGDTGAADKVLANCDRDAARLLRIADWLDKANVKKAHEIGEELARTGPAYGRYCRFYPLADRDAWPTSLIKPFVTAVAWLIKEFPDTAGPRIRAGFGDPDAKPRFRARDVVPPSSELIPKLINQLERSTSAGDGWEIRKRLADQLQAAERYDDAARVYGINVFAPRPKYSAEELFPAAAVDWCICRRRAEAMRFFAGHRERIIAARQTVYNILGPSNDGERVDGMPWLSAEQVTARLAAMDPGVLAIVFDDLTSAPVGAKERAQFVRLIADIGSEEDAPILITTLAQVVEDADRRAKGHAQEIEPSREAEEADFELVLNRALEKITRIKNTGDSPSRRLKFWLSWWDANARRVIRGGG